jgi:amino acid adenylation domain-containing protein
MTLLAGFELLLSRYTGQRDVVVGTPVAGRVRVELEGLIGLFVNTVALRVEMSDEMSFRELVRRVKGVCLGAYGHQEVPFERLVEEMKPEREGGRTPFFEAMLAWQNTPERRLEVGGLRFEAEEVGGETAKFDLVMSLQERDGEVVGRMEYSTEVFEAETAERFVRHYEALLRAAVNFPEQTIWRLSLLSRSELKQLMLEWGRMERDYAQPECIPELFERRAASCPEALAVVGESERMTYGELNARANRLAHRLIALGVGPDVLVGLLLERSVEMVVAILGILKAGGAYVPLDTSHPRERLAFMLDDARMKVLVTEENLSRQLPLHRAEVVCLDRDREEIERERTDNPDRFVSPDNTAYVIYTSGSTGWPKGVPVTHRNVVRLFAATRDLFDFSERDVWTLFHSYAFDFSVWELWGALLYGGRLVVVPYLVSRSPEAFYELLEREGVTVLNQTPSAFRQLMQAEERGAGEGKLALRMVIFGGEALELQSLRPWLERHGDERPQLVNMYGITETTVHVTYRRIRTADLESGRGSVIGGAIPDLQVYVLDQHQQPVPKGVAGELCIAGEGLARGYLNQPKLTAERFLPDPFGGRAGARLYRSGDLGRCLSEGGFEYLGRIDNQVKIRGFRIELGEIEAALVRHEAVRDAVVLVREDASGDKRLNAYVVAAPTSMLSPAQLREHLKEHLPEYMVPSAIVLLDALPLTANGKVDRRALPQIGESREGIGVEYVGPRTPIEEMLAAVWSEVLGLEQVGVHDDFFELGGHSLLATQVAARLTRICQTEVALHSIFDSPTIAGLAEIIIASVGGEQLPEIPPPVRTPGEIDAPLSFAQQRLWFLEQFEPGTTAYHLWSAIRIDGPLSPQLFERALSEVYGRHEVLRTSFPTVDGEPVQRIHPARRTVLPLIDLSELSEEGREVETKCLASEIVRQPFELALHSPVRATLLRHSPRQHLLLLTLHHIISDGWSLGLLVRELSTLYSAFSRGHASPLSELPIQYSDYSRWQRHYLQGDVLERQLSYWRTQLAGAPQRLELPTDRVRPKARSFRGDSCRVELDSELTRRLLELSRSEGATLHMTLLAGFELLLSRYTGQRDVVVGTPVAGRVRVELEGLIGLFVNTVALRVEMSDGMSFRELVRRVKGVCLGAYGHQEVPFERLVEELKPEREGGRTPFFEAMLAWQNTPERRLEVGGLRFEAEEVGGETAKFDMVMSLQERDGEVVGRMEYSTEVFEAETAERFVRHFKTLLSNVVAGPDRRISDYALLDEAERRKLLVEWNDTRREYPREACVHELFEAQVERRPDAIALVFEDEQLTFGELNARANQLAHYLRAQGVGPEQTVGICLERGPRLIVSLLGVLKAGGAYLPLDPQYPQERLAFMLEDAGVRVLLTEESVRTQAPRTTASVLSLDGQWDEVAHFADSDLPNLTCAENLAYVMYTSGSTGTPKGVGVMHRNVVRLVKQTDYASFSESEVFLLLAPISFDASTFELWGALLNGARLAVMAPGPASLEQLGAALKRHRVTTLWLTAGLFHLMVDERLEDLSEVRQLLAGGDVLSASHVERMRRELPLCRLINGYGPTEGTTFTCCESVAEDVGSTVPIGRPIANTEVYILDERQQPVPLGVSGELYLGGDGLARGYLKRAGLTAERFMPHPFSAEAGARLYRTGDLVKYLSNGSIEFLGRSDGQVKLRGFRIEPAEVESALCELKGVREAVVLLREEHPGEPRLVAYVVASQSDPAASEANATSETNGTSETSRTSAESMTGEWRAHLKHRLPDYMIPSAIVVMGELPLTPNGKVDRSALAQVEVGVGRGTGEYVGPRTPVEEVVAGVWREVLRVERVGVEENFFEMGGHSLLATRVVARLQEAFPVVLSLREFFAAPTIAEQAEEIMALLLQKVEDMPEELISGESPSSSS